MEDNSIREYINNQEYIKNSKKLINKLLNDHNYMGAFHSLLIALNTLNNNDKNEFIKYYHNDMVNKYTITGNHLTPAARY
jgi:hypothetical protein